ncbi:AraC family transcriptional regulator [Dyadobacter sp. LJ53]|uniref:AraC family transcriptional regulator n=1 Tax=Dyadobacter chenwenxiniae TaxID=2906456 RepID=UPI001F3D3331|nr:helix-turn-helix transcriptional regulator [Dyadobacter chenwenxiniae]MCF0051693.1 AraC family transcriptional regulator [Dyadobacter chenwenxiniae]
MKKSDVPRMELAPFTAETFTVPVLEVMYYSLNRPDFIIGDKASFPVIDYISPNRRNFFKIFHMTAGSGVLTVGLHRYEIGPGSIAFLHPDEIMSWQATCKETEGHFCMIHPKYLEIDADHVRDVFKTFPFFKADKAMVQLPSNHSDAVNGLFKNILNEERQNNEDKKQAILLYLQMILVETQRAGKNLTSTQVSEQYNYIYKFLELLESNFQLEQKGVPVKFKNAFEFAEQLNVHPNYLNTLVKQQTGKTLRDHIQDRILYEAKALLLQTDWDIANISYGLGFSGAAAFTTFFRNKEKMPPSSYRKSVLTQ